MPNFLGPFSQVFDLGGASGPVPQNTAAPTVSGSPNVGQTLTASNGTWSNSPTGYTYQWRRGGVVIIGATQQTYTVVAGDVGATLSVAVTATNANGAATAVSAETAVVTDALKPQDVFKTSLYTGTNANNTITTGFPPALVIARSRSSAGEGVVFDAARGAKKYLQTQNANPEGNSAASGEGPQAFLANGFTLGKNFFNENQAGASCVAWSWAEKKGFFCAVTYVGNGVAGRQIPHSLGVVPGMMGGKSLDPADQGGADGSWFVYHRGLTTPQSGCLFLNSTDGRNTAGIWANTVPTATEFTVSSSLNIAGRRYAMYLWAHNPDLIDCGSFTTDANGIATVNTGWPVQFLIAKAYTGGGGDWLMMDTVRGFGAGNDPVLRCNTSGAEATGFNAGASTANGFTTGGTAGFFGANSPNIYLAIRAPY